MRATLAEHVTPESFAQLQKDLPTWKIFSDTPLEVIAKKQSTREADNKKKRTPPKPPTRQQPPAVEKAFAEGMAVYRVAADHLPHPSAFDAIAESFGGTVVHRVEAKFTEVPMAALIAIPHNESNDAAWAQMCVEPFSCLAGLWYATLVRPPAPTKA